jgi:uncharacterized membrane protein (GlpM family)
VEILVRFIIGGLVVSLFALLADALKPRSFAGLFGAAPSVALATIALSLSKDGLSYTATEARSMLVGAVALIGYACVVGRLLARTQWPTWMIASLCLILWLGCALGISRAVF